MGVSFRIEEFKEVTKEFVGTIVEAEYSENPFGISGKFERGKVLGIKIVTEEYEKPQYEWYPPTNKKKTKWYYFIEALWKCGAMKEIVIAGSSDDERIQSLANQLVGMTFRWVDYAELEGFGGRKINLMLPEEYLGKRDVSTLISAKPLKVEEVKEL